MNGDRPNLSGVESSSSSKSKPHGPFMEDDLDGDDEGDLSLDNAILADDPLDKSAGKAP